LVGGEEGVAGVQNVVLPVFEKGTVTLVGAAAGDEIDVAAEGAGGVGGVDAFRSVDFRDGFLGEDIDEVEGIEHSGGGGFDVAGPVDPVDGDIGTAGGEPIEGEETGAGGADAGLEDEELGEVAAGLGEFGNLEAGEAVVEGGGGVLEESGGGGYGDLFDAGADLECDGEAGLLGGFEADGGSAEGLEAGSGGFEGVEAGRQEGEGELAAFVGFRFEGGGGLFVCSSVRRMAALATVAEEES